MASGGPKTTAGKARSARNALRHALSIPVCKRPSLSIQTEEIALKIAGPDPDEALLDRARAVAEAQVDLKRVRARRNTLVSELLAHPEYQPLPAYKSQVRKMRTIDRIEGALGTSFDFDVIEPLIELEPLKSDQKFATAIEARTRELSALDRYERRAISKRKSAIPNGKCAHHTSQSCRAAIRRPYSRRAAFPSPRAGRRKRSWTKSTRQMASKHA
jgi:hypothetical protein